MTESSFPTVGQTKQTLWRRQRLFMTDNSYGRPETRRGQVSRCLSREQRRNVEFPVRWVDGGVRSERYEWVGSDLGWTLPLPVLLREVFIPHTRWNITDSETQRLLQWHKNDSVPVKRTRGKKENDENGENRPGVRNLESIVFYRGPLSTWLRDDGRKRERGIERERVCGGVYVCVCVSPLEYFRCPFS